MSPALFTPIKVGDITLQHRIVLCPLTRNRANDQHVHTDLATEYYSQRASEPGTLLITEGTFIAPQAGGYENVPGCYNDEQIAAWKKIVDAVHAKGSYIYLQLWALGRAATAETLRAEGGYQVVSASDIPRLSGSDIPLDHERDTEGRDRPRPLTIDEIKEYVGFYVQAAKNFVIGAGGDGVEVHGANGYLVDQFTQNISNVRKDMYGGSVENRSRFCLEVVEAVSAAVGEHKVGLRLSPFSTFQDMRMADPDIIETFTYLVTELKNRHPNMAYLHAGEPRVGGGNDLIAAEGDSLEFLHKIWTHQPMIVAGSYTPETARSEAEARPNALIGFGRHFIANPDLPRRIREGIELNKYNRETFYLKGYQPTGYTDYPFAK